MKIKSKHAPFDHHMAEPDTSWHFILVGLVIAVTLCFAIFVAVSLIEVAMIV